MGPDKVRENSPGTNNNNGELIMRSLLVAATITLGLGAALPASAQMPRDAGQQSPLALRDTGQTSPLARSGLGSGVSASKERIGAKSPLAKSGQESPLAKPAGTDLPLAKPQK